MTVYDIAAKLPPIDVLRDRCKALAVVECIIGATEPYYGYTTDWGDDEAGLMSNGSGDEWAVVFTGGDAFVRVFSHESQMTPYRDQVDRELWPGLLDGLPATFLPQVREPAFADEDEQFLATAVLWRRAQDERWHAGEGIEFPPARGPYDTDLDGSGMLEILLDDIVARTAAFVEDYHEIEPDRAAIEHIVGHRPLTETVVRALNPDATLAELHGELVLIGYPLPAA